MNVNVIFEGGQACENHLRTGGGKKSEKVANVIYEWPPSRHGLVLDFLTSLIEHISAHQMKWFQCKGKPFGTFEHLPYFQEASQKYGANGP